MLDGPGQRRLAVFVVGIAAAMLPRRGLERLPPVCPIRLVTGYPCPTCGMTRSWHSVARLDPLRAVRDHPFGPIVLAAIATGAWSPTSADRMARQAGQLPTRVKVVALAAWVGWWASRLIATRRARG